MTDDERPAHEPEEQQQGDDACRIARIIRWGNDMVMVFCQHGVQMPAYQGRHADVFEQIERDRGVVEWERGTWRSLPPPTNGATEMPR